ncbi:hypothetical protein KFS98_003523 [Salmonella enterica]|nr:hypothetical protein [Salmonella enterica]
MTKKNLIIGSTMSVEPINLPMKNAIQAAMDVKIADPGRFQNKLMDLSWLSAAAPEYNISPNLSDYQFGRVRSLTAELPNRNGHNFQFKELVAFCIKSGSQYYRTFEGKPLLVNHEYVLPKAIGINVLTSLVQDGSYIVVENIIAVDRTKNPKAAEEVRLGKAKFSMGATAPAFECSICHEIITDLDKPCAHTKSTALLHPFFDISKDEPERTQKAVLAYLNVKNPLFHELSYLDGQLPADPRAWSRDTSI